MSLRRLLAVPILVALAVPAAATAAREDASLYRIPFSSGVADPARDFPAADPAAHDLVLVQWREFGDAHVVERIAATGAELVQPLAPVSYLVWADAAQTAALRRVDGIRWAGVLPASARIGADVADDTTALRVTLIGGGALPGVEALRLAPRTFTAVAGSVAAVRGGLAVARRLATEPRVYSIAADTDAPALREERSNMVVAKGTGPGSSRAAEYRNFLEQYKADGTGVVISHVDTGVDFNHPELRDRVAGCINYKTDSAAGCTIGNHDDVVGHGTHTLGTVLGNGSTGLGDLDGMDYGLGMAPGAKAVVQNAIHTGVGASAFAGGYRPVYRAAQDLGATISQNSWGPSGSPRGYDAATREFDTIVRDVDDSEAGDQAMTLVFSIMNGSGGTSTQGSPDEGKNLIGVGASGNRGVGAPGFDDLCTCTAHGPALDGRLLPTLVAPGQQVISTRATQGTLCGVPFIGYSPTTPATETPPSPLHAGCTGTSMASPHVSGAAAVFTDFYRDRFAGATPSPALVKAAFVNGAQDLAGGRDADGGLMTHIPNNQQGWGRLHLGNVLGAWSTATVHVDQSEVFTAGGERRELVVEAADLAKPLKVTLAWTDAPGPGTGGKTPAWVNDLDLEVVGPDGTTWIGNVFRRGASVTGGTADRKNNLENVFLTTPAAGTYTVRVKAANIIGDGLPNVDDPTDQDYALVITNARTAATAG